MYGDVVGSAAVLDLFSGEIDAVDFAVGSGDGDVNEDVFATTAPEMVAWLGGSREGKSVCGGTM